jgi:hypothetical protein
MPRQAGMLAVHAKVAFGVMQGGETHDGHMMAMRIQYFESEARTFRVTRDSESQCCCWGLMHLTVLQMLAHPMCTASDAVPGR